MIRQAVIDGEYRYSLTRIWDEATPVLLFVMLNPSTADGMTDDATIRWCVSFAKRWGFGGIEVVNLFAYRATNPIDLTVQAAMGFDSVSDERNDVALLRAFSAHSYGIAAWGATGIASSRSPRVLEIAASRGCKLWSIGTTLDGSPRHPLRQRLDSIPVPL